MDKKKLASAEWNFSALKPQEIDAAFFYEFSRSSKVVVEKVELYRSLHWVITDFLFTSPLCLDGEIFDSLVHEEQAKIQQKLDAFKKNSFLRVIDWLSYCPKFPEIPFLDLAPADYREKGRGLPIHTRGFIDLGFHSQKTSMLPGIFLNEPNYHKAVSSPGLIEEHESLHVVMVDWRKTNGELVEDFTSWLALNREELWGKETRPAARGLFNEPLPFPDNCKKKDTALVNLGKLRCLEASAHWGDYMQSYNSGISDDRNLKKDVAVARQLIDWFDSQA